MKSPKFTATSTLNIVLHFAVAVFFLWSAWWAWDMNWFNYADTFAAGVFAGTLVTLATFLLSDVAVCVSRRIKENRE